MFRTVGDQVSLWEAVLPAELLRLPDELARVDGLLDDPVFFAPFVPFFGPRMGRPSTPMETYLRLMFLKFRYRLGYESLCREVSRFDHLAAVLPDPAGRAGAASDHVDEADHPLRQRGGGRAQRGVVGQGGRGEAVAHQPDTGRYHGGAGERVRIRPIRGCWPRRFAGSLRPASGFRPPVARVAPRLRDRSRAAGRRAHADRSQAADPLGGRPRPRHRPRCSGSPASWPSWPPPPTRPQRLLHNAKQALRRGRATADKLRERGVHDAAAGRRRGRLARAVDDLTELLDATRQIVAQTRQRVAGHTPDGATRRVSLHDGDARPIAKGRLGRPVEFGHKAQVVDNDRRHRARPRRRAGQSCRCAPIGAGRSRG